MAVEAIDIPQGLAFVLNRAGDKSGVDFDYLLKTAIRESSLNPGARAQTSSATGLFQFVEQTWFDVMKSDGPRLGYQDYADAIHRTPEGGYTIEDPALREEVLKLRENPQIAADLAAAFTKRNGDYLNNRFGRMPSPGELYIAHFMGAQGAERFFEAGLQNPNQLAANLFPREAAANRNIFYTDGKPKTIRDVYRSLVAKHDPAADRSTFTAQQLSGRLPTVTGPIDVDFHSLFQNGSGANNRGGPGPSLRPGSGFFADIYSK